MEEFFDNIRALNYPGEKMDVYISCQSQKRLEFVQNIAKSWIKDKIYHSVTLENQFKGKLTNKHGRILNFDPRSWVRANNKELLVFAFRNKKE